MPCIMNLNVMLLVVMTSLFFFVSCSRQCSFMTIVSHTHTHTRIMCELQESLGLLAQGGAVYLAPKKCCFSLCYTKFFLTTSPI